MCECRKSSFLRRPRWEGLSLNLTGHTWTDKRSGSGLSHSLPLSAAACWPVCDISHLLQLTVHKMHYLSKLRKFVVVLRTLSSFYYSTLRRFFSPFQLLHTLCYKNHSTVNPCSSFSRCVLIFFWNVTFFVLWIPIWILRVFVVFSP